ncbi:hypothetical protein [Halalkalibacter oceani]|uniref:hypothetical protein n=1 Tax=Halalkalibacter oceani TaxID=1653776 RepID=UPI002042367D|nr:hypothetical protein [Halalkalibacter oceani]
MASKDLKLSYEESEVWFYQQPEIEMNAIQLSDIFFITDGCPALLHLAVQHNRSDQGVLMDSMDRITPSLEGYVLGEWLQHIPEAIWTEIHPLCVTPYFTIDFAKKLIQKVVHSLILLLEQHCLLCKTNVRNRWLYRFHPHCAGNY